MKRRKKSRLFGDLKAGVREVLEIERGNIEPVSGGQIKKAVFIDRLFFVGIIRLLRGLWLCFARVRSRS